MYCRVHDLNSLAHGRIGVGGTSKVILKVKPIGATSPLADLFAVHDGCPARHPFQRAVGVPVPVSIGGATGLGVFLEIFGDDVPVGYLLGS